MNDETLTVRIARNVRTMRAHYGWSLARLAERAGISVNIVKHLLREGSNPGISIVIRLANAAGISLNELVGEELDRAALPDESNIVPRYADPEALAKAIGPRTRAYRMREKWSRRKFIEHAKISKGMLHYLESNEVEPSVTMVERLATAFNLSFADFVEVAESPVIAIGPQIRDFDDCRLAGRQHVAAPTAPPGSTAMLYVIDGTICVSFQSERHLLQNGDAVLLMTDRPYTVANTTAAPARFLRIARTGTNAAV
jgi:transcriptional regulator with XRE-family HTH domain